MSFVFNVLINVFVTLLTLHLFGLIDINIYYLMSPLYPIFFVFILSLFISKDDVLLFLTIIRNKRINRKLKLMSIKNDSEKKKKLMLEQEDRDRKKEEVKRRESLRIKSQKK